MHLDPVIACLLTLLGATLFYLVDEVFRVTPRILSWFDGRSDEL